MSIWKPLCLTVTASLLIMVGCGRNNVRCVAHEQTLHTVDSLISIHSPKARTEIDRAMREAGDSLTWYEIYSRLGHYYGLSATPDSIVPILDKTDRYLASAPDGERQRQLRAYTLNTRGAHYHNFYRKAQEVIELYQKAYTTLMQCDDKTKTPDVMANLGDAFLFADDLPRAAASYRRAMFLADSLNLPQAECTSLYLGLAYVYQQLGDNKNALRLYSRAEKQIDDLPVNMQAYLLNNFGSYYYYTQDYHNALAKFLTLSRFLEEHDMAGNFDMFLCKVNLADVYLNLDSLDKASAFIDEVEPFALSHGDQVSQYYCNTIRIGIAVKQRRWSDAARYNASDAAAKDIPFTMRDIRARYLRGYYEATGNYHTAYRDVLAHSSYEDSLEHKLTNMRAADIMAQFIADTLRLHADLMREQQHTKVVLGGTVAAIAVGVAVILTLLLIVHVLRSRKDRLEARMRIMDLRLLSARGKISPHFIFNVLNNHIITSESDNDGTLLNLTKLIRHNLDMSRQLAVSLQEELDFVSHYVAAEKPMVGDDFDFLINIERGVDAASALVPSMLIQIMAENAIVHALSGWQGHKVLHIDVCRQEGVVTVSVTDNGPGFNHKALTGEGRTGIGIIRETLAVINSRNRQPVVFKVENVTDNDGHVKGCRTVLTIPENLKL